MKLTIKNIGILAGIDESGRERIAGADMKRLDTITNAYVTAEEGLIVSYGPMEELPEGRADEEIDARGGVVLPAFCDSHTHIVYAGSREGEFVDKINGLSYEEIARRGGGILNSADRLHTATEQELYDEAMPRLRTMKDLEEFWIEINRLENAGDKQYRRILTKLFSGQYEALEVLKLKDIVDSLEHAIDAFERVANTIEQIHVKES